MSEIDLMHALNHQQWMADALCAQVDPDLFFPEKGGLNHQAKATCLKCPVRVECATYAIENDEPFGVWGMTSEHDRRKPRRAAS